MKNIQKSFKSIGLGYCFPNSKISLLQKLKWNYEKSKFAYLDKYFNQKITIQTQENTVDKEFEVFKQLQNEIEEFYTAYASVDYDPLNTAYQKWQSRRLSKFYLIFNIESFKVKIKENDEIVEKNFYIPRGLDINGQNDILDIWSGVNESADFWNNFLLQLKCKGIERILIACVDHIKSLTIALSSIYPHTKIKLSIPLKVAHSLYWVNQQDKVIVFADLKTIYTASSLNSAEKALQDFSLRWDFKYPMISRIWYENWNRVVDFFEDSAEIRHAIISFEAFKYFNSFLENYLDSEKIFISENYALNYLFLKINHTTNRFSEVKLNNWNLIRKRFFCEYSDQLSEYVH